MRNYLVIGASSGIGRATADLIQENGDQVIGTYNSKEVDDADYPMHQLDVTADIDLGFLPETIDGLVYCPGAINLLPFHRIKEQDFLADYKLQVLGAIKVIQACLPALKKSGNASIVLYSTVAVQSGFNFHAQVSTSKGAIEGLTKALAAEFAPKIRVNAIAPSLTDTPLAERLLNSDPKKQANADRHPMKRVGKAEDIAEMTSFLLSDRSSWVTGQIFHVDGGMSTINKS